VTTSFGTGWRCVCGVSGLTTIYCPYCGRTSPLFTPPPPYAGPVPPPPGRVGLDRRGKRLALLIALTLLVGLNRAVVRLDQRTEARRAARQAALERVVAELETFVAARHGGPFTRTVAVRLLDDREFVVALRAGGALPDDDLVPSPTRAPVRDNGDFDATLRAFGLADAGDGSEREARNDLLTGGVFGLYDERRGRLLVRGSAVTPFARMVLVHELTHAWQDQHYGLTTVHDKSGGGGKDDSDRAVTALVEGDASRVEQDWRDAQSEADRAAIAAYERELNRRRRGEPSRVERTLDALYGFPYTAGERFVRALYERGGNAAVDAAFAHPPLTTEEVLRPALYPRRGGTPEVPAPRADGTLVDDGTLGQVGLVVLLGRGEVTREAVENATGWEGDAYVTWRDGDRVCARLALRMDSPAARDRVLVTLRPRGVLRSVGATELVLRSCATGTAGP
jgi:hypothetical protein